jgi:hypothetical protein
MKAFLRIFPRPSRGKAPPPHKAPHTFPSLVWGGGYAPSSRIEGTLFSYGVAVEQRKEEKGRDLAIPACSWWLPG